MQRTDLIRSKKWAMEDAFLREVGASLSGSTSMCSWNEPWEISTKNRDRPGGHQAARYYHRSWKKADKRKARREHRKIIAEAVRDFYEDHELYLQEMAALYDEFWDDIIAYDDFWDDKFEAEMDMGPYDLGDYYDPFWDLCYPV